MIDPSSRLACVTNIYGDIVSVIDIEARKVVSTIVSGAGPNGISYSPMAPATAPSPKIELVLSESMDGMDMGG